MGRLTSATTKQLATWPILSAVTGTADYIDFHFSIIEELVNSVTQSHS